MCEVCEAQKKAGVREVGEGIVEREKVIAFVEEYRAHFADTGTDLMMAGFLQLLYERIKESMKVTPENEHLFMGANLQLILGDMTGCRLSFEPLERVEGDHLISRSDALRMAQQQKEKGVKLQ